MNFLNKNKDTGKISENQKIVFSCLVAFTACVGTAQGFSDLFLLYWPELSKSCQLIIRIMYICILILISLAVWHRDKSERKEDTMTEDELRDKCIKKAIWMTNIDIWFKLYPKNAVTLKFIPISICSVIKFFTIHTKNSGIEKNGYYIDLFNIPTYWSDYPKLIEGHFKPMFRFYVSSLKITYEIKFKRNFKELTIRWLDSPEDGIRKFKEPLTKTYAEMFKHPDITIPKWVTWITPFGLWWNFIRLLKFVKYYFKLIIKRCLFC